MLNLKQGMIEDSLLEQDGTFKAFPIYTLVLSLEHFAGLNMMSMLNFARSLITVNSLL